MAFYMLFSGHPSRSRSRASLRTLALVVIAVSSLVLFDALALAAGRGCRAQCRQACRSECGSPEVECGTYVASQMDLRRDCRNTVNSERFEMCRTERCLPVADVAPGRCTLTRECVDGCRANRLSQLAGCDRRFRAGIRTCPGGASCLAAERTTRKGCTRQCRQACVASCRTRPATTAPAPQELAARPLMSACGCQGS